jgi:hypothetical protein
MPNILDYPLLVLVVTYAACWLASRIGVHVRHKVELEETTRDDLGVLLAAALTLLALIIGFNLSAAISRYDQRKNLEEAEANAIGTEFVRADLLPAADGAKVRALLRKYTDERIRFYVMRDEHGISEINASTVKLQGELWSTVVTPALAQPTTISALAVNGMNDVLNSQGYTQAAWWNRIPTGAWALMAIVAACCALLRGYGARSVRAPILVQVLPFIVAISFFLIADIDSPRSGIIRVAPQNLESLAESLRPQ